MIINAINKFCAKHGRATYLFIGVVIIIPFVFLYGDFGGTLQGGSSRNPVIGKIYGESITRKDFLQHLQAIRINFYLDYQRYLPANNDQVIKALSPEVLNRIRILHKAQELGIAQVTPQEIQEKIMEYPAFQEEGKFDRKKFDEFRDDFLKAEGASAQDFDDIVKANLIVGRLEKQITESLTIPDTEARAYYVENFAKCQAHVSNFYSYKHTQEITVSEEEVEEYFKKNLETKYRVPEQKQIQAVVFDSDSYLESHEITEEGLKEYYEKNKAENYTKKQLHLKHILIETGSDDSEDKKQEKRSKLEALHKEINDGATFDDIAKANSEDNTTARKSGDLGFMDQNVVRSRFSADFEEQVTDLSIDEVSNVIESPKGFHLVKKVDEREVIPFTEVQDEIRAVVERAKDEEEANDYYKANKEAEYSKQEVHARHILLKIDPEDDDASKEEKRRKLEEILDEARTKKNFYELAQLHSEDQSNAKKGGDLGYFGKGKMVKAFEDTAFTMKKGEISDIVETQFGYHIIEKLDERDVQPFEDVKDTIISTLKQERTDKAKAIAAEKATSFAIEVHKKLDSVPNEQKAASFVKLCEEYSQEADAVVPVESEFFTSDDYTIPGVPGSTKDLINEAIKLSAENPLSEVVESRGSYYVCCWQASKDSYLPDFREDDNGTMKLTKHGKKAERDLKNERAVAKAREECRKAYEEIIAKLKDGVPFEEAKGEYSFTATGEFALSQGPRIANSDIVKKEAQKTPANTLVAPQDIPSGAILVYIESHRLPTEDDYENVKAFWIPQFQYQQQQLVLKNYYKDLENESDTRISEEWQFLFESEPEDGSDGVDNT